ncbi:MAG TPA: nicotinate-nucleotide adenylyltransferase [Clostridiales bacterium]|nr:nicotinate-nucleotide adenylyltransferase [Clostridiales bacterium]
MKIGVLGGSFNPIHFGHLLMAESAYEQMELDKVIFMPLKYPPHKNKEGILCDQHRLNMIELAIQDNPHFELSKYEIKKDSVSYTAETLSYLTSKNPNDKFFFILGADSYMMIDKWRQPQTIFKQANILVINRDNNSSNELDIKTIDLKKDYNLNVTYINMPNIGISSTVIRERLKDNLSIKYYMPNSVIHYITKHKIYC